jgi:hypothetical protein
MAAEALPETRARGHGVPRLADHERAHGRGNQGRGGAAPLPWTAPAVKKQDPLFKALIDSILR